METPVYSRNSSEIMDANKKIDKKNIEDILALTPMQEGILFYYLEDPQSDHYFEQLSLDISGEIDIEIFEKAWNFVIEINEMLRTVFRWEKVENPIQVILKKHHLQPGYYDLSKEKNDEKKRRLEKIKAEDREKKFDLQEVPFRVILCRVDKYEYEFIISHHHILYDGWSTGIILEEFFYIYNELSNGSLDDIASLMRSRVGGFKGFVKFVETRDKQEQEEFWRAYLEGVDHGPGLPVKERRRIGPPGSGDYHFRFPLDFKHRLEVFAKEYKVTVASLFYTGWGILLQKYTNTDDVVFGTTVSGRNAKADMKGIEHMVGLLINTLPLRVNLLPGEPMIDLLVRTTRMLHDREAVAHTSLVKIKEYSGIHYREELFDTLVVIENYPLEKRLAREGNTLAVKAFSMRERTHYDLTATITLFDDIRVGFGYDRQRFDDQTAARLGLHFMNIIRAVISGPQQPVSQLEIISEAEKQRILFEFNRTEVEYHYMDGKTIYQLFEEQVGKNPDNVALVGKEEGWKCGRVEGKKEEGTRGLAPLYISYRELKENANRLAHLLIKKGVKPDTIVGIMMERSVDMIIGILGILKAGGAYLPIDPGYPQMRIDYILTDSGAKFLLVVPETKAKIEVEEVSIELIDIFGLLSSSTSTLSSTFSQVGPANLAYIIYTSGSTGRPKGVLVEQPSVVNILQALHNEYHSRESDTYLLKTSVVFDVSVTELFGWFLGGGRLAVLQRYGERAPGVIINAVERFQVTHLNFVSSMFRVFLEGLTLHNIDQLSSLKYIFLAGEELLPGLVQQFRRLNTNIALENLYGPTESTVYSCGYSLSQWEGTGSIPIGKSLQNTRLYILDNDNHLQPIGVPGQLAIGGIGLARGYLNQPGLTAEKFDHDLWNLKDYRERNHRSYRSYRTYIPTKKIYKTGDLARWLADGNIEFLGRIDHQVKIRGFRIELGEIENQLLKHKNIKEAAVRFCVGGEQDEPFLCAYIVPAGPGGGFTLKKYLMNYLPDYMVPAIFMELERLPRTTSGKLDKNALPPPRVSFKTQYAAPRDKTEETLVEVWSGLLGIEKETIGIDDNFFQLGGNSLKVVRLAARIHKIFNKQIPIDDIFENPTIRVISLSLPGAVESKFISIPPIEKKEYYPVSSAQKQFFVFQQLYPGDVSYNMPEAMMMEGELDPGIFKENLKKLIYRHESLRTSFLMVKGEPVQRIYSDEEVEFELEYYDRAHVSSLAAHYNYTKNKEVYERFVRPFVLSQPPLMRLGLMEVEKSRYLFMFDMHHIISDGTSIGIFIKEFLLLNKGEELPYLRLHYKDYSEWRNRKKKQGREENQVHPGGFDKEGEKPLELPVDFVRPAIPNFEGKKIKFQVGADETQKLYALALREENTLYMVLLAVFYVFLSKLSGQEDIVVGSPMAGRFHYDLEYIIGLFINNTVLRSFPLAHQEFIDFLKEVKANALWAYENQDYDYEELVEKVVSLRGMGRNPFFDVMFVLQNMEVPGIEIPGLKVTRDLFGSPGAKFDLTLYGEEKDGLLEFTLEYRTSLFKEATIRRFSAYIATIIEHILENPCQVIGEIEFIPAIEKEQVLYEFNRTLMDYPENKTIHELFEEQAVKIPDRVAVAGRMNNVPGKGTEVNDNDVSLTYSQLNALANRVARLLLERRIKPNSTVGIMIPRSIRTMIGILAVLKSGGAYLPIDPGYPGKRILTMLEQSQAALLLAGVNEQILEQKGLKNIRQEIIHIGHLEELFSRPRAQEVPYEKNLGHTPGPGDLIYIIFTSGSTGVPKGAGLYHRGFMNLMNWFVNEFQLDSRDKVLLLTSLSFDLTQKNLYAPLIIGGTLCIPPGDYFDPGLICRQIRKHRVTWINCTPSMFYRLIEMSEEVETGALGSLGYVFLGGEPISVSRLIAWMQTHGRGTEVVNTYGPTECTDICASYRIREPERFLERAVPVGAPVYNVRLYILDKNLRVLPVGIPGELGIAGDGVGFGYVNDAKMTAEKFITLTLEERLTALVYRTGDLTKWLPEGTIEFISRIDHQVKIRGFRIEPGEIESRLRTHPKIKEVAVVARQRNAHTEDYYLTAYIVPHETTDTTGLESSELTGYLSDELPQYMVPSYFIRLEEMPLSPNGKVDRDALPGPDLTANKEYIAPRHEMEEKLVKIWSAVLGIDRLAIGIDDNFFELGGHSLRAASLIAQIHKEFNKEIQIAEIFEVPTIREMSSRLGIAERKVADSIGMTEKREYYALSSQQRRIYIHQQMDPGGSHYNIPHAHIMEGDFGQDRLETIFQQLLGRHESLRTWFEMADGEPVQRIQDEVIPGIEYYDLYRTPVERGLAPLPIEPAARNPKLAASTMKNFIRPFNLSRAPLLRVGWGKLTGQRHLLAVDIHHIISDGISLDILVKEFTALIENKRLSPLRIQYKDYAQWQNREEQRQSIKRQEAYWDNQYSRGDDIPILHLPCDYPRPPFQRFEGNSICFEIDEESTRGLYRMVRAWGVTLYMVLLAAFKVLLSKLSSQDDIIVGSPTAGRRHMDLDNIIGMFVNTLALRSKPSGEKPLKHYLQELKEITLAAFENQDYPFEDLVEQVTVVRDAGRNPIFDVMFLLNNINNGNDNTSTGTARVSDWTMIPLEKASLEGKAVSGVQVTLPDEFRRRTAKFDLTLAALEDGEDISFSLQYSTQLFKEETCQRFVGYFKKIISLMVKDPGVKLCRIEMIPEEEKKQLLCDFNNTGDEYPGSKSLPWLFEEQVKRTPDHTALVGNCQWLTGKDPFGQSIAITYSQLNHKSHQLAGVLIEKGVMRDTIVGIMVERSIEMIIGLLGILKAGGAYLPIDPGYPQERISYMLNDSGANILLTENEVTSWLKDGPKAFNILWINPPATSLGYVIYTSGSTGKPKGIMVEHRNVVNVVWWFARKYNLAPGTHVLQMSDYTFDPSVNQVFGTLLHGAVLYLISKATLLNVELLRQFIENHFIHVVNFVPLVLNELLNPGPKLESIRVVLSGGERLDDAVKNNILEKGYELYNQYGPTETTIDALVEKCSANKVTLGTPISNVRCYIMDKYSDLAPIGVTGELWIGGAGISRGYLNNPGLTAEKFDQDLWDYRDGNHRFYRPYRSYRTYISNKIYKTGDLARWLPEGNIEFLGRMDHQVKIRGYRIETGEIESRLLAHEQVKEAVVLAKTNQGSKFLCAYIVPRPTDPGTSLETSELKTYLNSYLPAYMIPFYFIQLERIPLTAQGKIDRQALVEIVIHDENGRNYLAPRDPLEEKLAEIWGKVLKTGTQAFPLIGIGDNFFERGGHSLSALVMIANIQREFNVKVPLAEVFRVPHIKGLARYIRGSKRDKYTSPQPVEKKEYYALSSAQKRLYILQQMELNSTAYNMPTFITVKEPDIEKLEETISGLIRRHESLRTSFHMVGNEPVQRIHNEVEFEIKYYDIYKTQVEVKVKVEQERSSRFEGTGGLAPLPIIKNFIRSFDLSQGPLLRVGLIKAGALHGAVDVDIDVDVDVLMIDMHHIISDGISLRVLEQEFTALYGGEQLPPLAIQYKDFSEWQNSEREKEIIKIQEKYWLREFAGEIPVLNLPTDYPRPALQSFAGDIMEFEIPGDETRGLKAAAQSGSCTLFMVILAVFKVLLAKLSSQEDIVVGTPTAGRRHADIQRTIGMFVNTLAMRNYPQGRKTFSEFLQEVKEQTLEAFENQDYQFADLVEQAAVVRDAGRNPIFDVMLLVNNINGVDSHTDTGSGTVGVEISDAAGVEMGETLAESRTAKFDLTLAAVEKEDKISFSFQYCTALFKQETIQRFIAYFKKIITVIGKDPGVKLSWIEVLGEGERKRLLYDFNDTAGEYPRGKTLHRLFEEEVKKTPDHIALIGRMPTGIGTRLKASAARKPLMYLTYNQLNKKSNQLAHRLREKGVRPDRIAAIMVERSMEMIVGIFAVLKAGGAYLPVEPGYPGKRVTYLLEDSTAQVLLTRGVYIDELSSPGVCEDCEMVDLEGDELYKGDQCNLSRVNSSHDAVYILYTSGSTGVPKGVMIEHEAVVNILYYLYKKYPFDKGDTYLFKTSYGFDVSVSELFGWFFGGGRLGLLEPGGERDPEMLVAAINEMFITHINFVPAMFNAFVDFLKSQNFHQLSGLRYIFLAGEAVSPQLVNKFRELEINMRLENIYGPTEAAIYSSGYGLSDWNGVDNISIGKPLQNVRIYILGNYDQIQPIGVAGELCISGTGLARGYLNNPGLTREKFNKKLLWGVQGGGFLEKSPPGRRRQNTYKTGDRARWLPGGNIEFLGRMDHQVKIRGFRIEPGEIRYRLLEIPGIREAVVVDREDETSAGRYLCAYFVSDSTGKEEFTTSGLRELLLKKLPGFMVPSYFVQVEAIPLTPGGKIDRKALPAPGITVTESYIAPKDQIQRRMVKIWSEVLSIEEKVIGIDVNFFELGGHSLKVIQLINRIHHDLQVKIPFGEVFRTPTIRGLSGYAKELTREPYVSICPVEEKEYYGLSPAQRRMYILQETNPGSTAYNMAGLYTFKGNITKEQLEDIFKQLIERHGSLRTSFDLAAGEPVQRVHKKVEFEIEYYELQVTGASDRCRWEFAPLLDNFIRPFNLSQAPLLRVGLLELPHTPAALRGHPSQEGRKGKYFLLMVDMHHIISDGISMIILRDDFQALLQGETLPGLSLRYKDYAQWLNRDEQKQATARHESYWLELFNGQLPVLRMPLDFRRPGKRSFAGSAIPFTIPGEQVKKLQQLAKKQGITLNILLFAVYSLLVHKYSSQDDMIIGSLAAGRNHEDLEHIVGMFANFLPIRIKINPALSFMEFLEAASETMISAYAHQDYPFEELVAKVAEGFSSSRNPLFDTMLIVHTHTLQQLKPEAEIHAGVKEMNPRRASTLDFKVDMVLTASGGLEGRLEYDTRLFKEETMKRFIYHYQCLIREIPLHTQQKIPDIKVFTKEEEQELSLKRERCTISSPKTIPLAVSATFTWEPAADYTRWWGEQFDFRFKTVSAPYNQVFQELLDESGLLSTHTGINLLLVRFEDWIRDINAPDAEKCEKLETDFKRLVKIIENKNLTSPYFVGIFPTSLHLGLSPAVQHYIEGLNLRWYEFLKEVGKGRPLYVIDFTGVAELYQINEVFDAVKDREGHMPFSDEFYAAMGTMIARQIQAYSRPTFKVIVLDCDNTLWQGICGEDGPLGVQVEEPHRQLQQFMLQKSKEGMLLCLCSKNNETDVWEVFEKNPHMILRKEHIVDWKINWQPKSKNLEELAHRLNLGIDSFILVDDSPVECWEVINSCPEVLTLKLPENPGHIPLFLKHVWAFDKIEVTEEDQSRTRMYQEEKRRKQVEAASISLTDFFSQLELKVSMNIMKSQQVKRVSQLTQRTNQFNLSTRRRTEEEIISLSEQDGTTCWVVEVSDRFGDYGLVGVVITVNREECLFIDTFLLSCRVLGRGVEDAILIGLKKHCGNHRLSQLQADFYPTQKNRPFLNFLEKRWKKDHTREICTGYTCNIRDITESELIPFVDLYFLESFENKEDKPALPADWSLINEKEMENRRNENKSARAVKWEVPGIEEQGKLHWNHWLALSNTTGRQLLDLPLNRLETDRPGKETYISPYTGIQKKLIDIWADVLHIGKEEREHIGLNANFLALGGNSLKAISLIAKLHQAFNVKVQLTEVFKYLTLGAQAEYINGAAGYKHSDLEAVEEKEYYATSPAQRRLYLIQEMDSQDTSYNISQFIPLELPGNIEVHQRELAETFKKLIDRHDSLRTSFQMLDGVPVQRIHPRVEFLIEYHPLKDSETMEGMANSFVRPFDLSQAPLIRVGLTGWDSGLAAKFLLVDIHHIISDGMSIEIITRDFMRLYQGEELSGLRVRYKDYSEWSGSETREEKIKKQEKYWLEQCKKEWSILPLPCDYPRPTAPGFKGNRIDFVIDNHEAINLKTLAQNQDVTLFMLLLAVYNVLLSKLSGQEDIIVCTVVAGRDRGELEQIVGMFLNTLMLRNYPTGEKTFKNFLQHLKNRTLEAFENQDYPFENLVEKVVKKCDNTWNGIYNVGFVLHNFRESLQKSTYLKHRQYQFKQPPRKEDLCVEGYEMEGELLFSVIYWPELFKEETIQRFIDSFKIIASTVTRDPGIKITDIEIISADEKNMIVSEVTQAWENINVEFDM
jgi:tyrocidine synthetase-3